MKKKAERQQGQKKPFIDPAQSRMARIIPDIGDSMSVIPAHRIQAEAMAGSGIVRRVAESNIDMEMLFRQYMQRLTDDGVMLKLSDVKKMDILDITSFAVLPEDGYTIPRISDASREERDAIERLDWYSLIPCFEKGALKLNRFRYIVFEIEEVDPENRSVTIRLYDYMRINGVWQTGVATTIKATDFRELDKTMDDATGLPVTHHVVIEHFEDRDFEELYTMYEWNELGWTKRQWGFWEDVVIRNTRAVSEKLKDEYNTSQCEQLAAVFLKIIGRCNAMLEMNKPSRPVKNAVPKGRRTAVYEQGSAPGRKTRNVGLLKVQSKNIPKKPCLETIVTYKVAKWTVRGHVRHYANGREVYIKPAVRKRKALADTDEATATTIRFRKKKTNKEHE